MRRLLLLSTGRRSKFLVALLGILFAAGLASQSGKLEQVQKSDTADFLPGGAESVLALEAARRSPPATSRRRSSSPRATAG